MKHINKERINYIFNKIIFIWIFVFCIFAHTRNNKHFGFDSCRIRQHSLCNTIFIIFPLCIIKTTKPPMPENQPFDYHQIKLDDKIFWDLLEVAKTMPGLLELKKNASLPFVNRHFSFDISQALLKNVIGIGGIHLSRNKNSLPDEFGTTRRKEKAFLKVFKKNNHTALWKWEEDVLHDKPDNVEKRKWLPQSAILAHPSIKIFISHGGYIGTQEAIYNGVPLVGIPIYGDQYMNLLTVEERGMGKLLKYHDVTEESLEKCLTEVLYNNSYRDKAKKIAQKYKDRPMSALDTAVYWIEYVIRYKGADHMKNPAMSLSWIAYNMFDVYL